MKYDNFTIRTATVDDAETLLKIYAPYVKNTAITFEYEVPSLDEFKHRIFSILKKYPYLVAETDNQIIGYAYASTFKGRAAYDWSVETTIYIKNDCHGCGIGKLLYKALEKILKQQNILNMNSCISYPQNDDAYLTKGSVYFHEKMGFNLVGKFHNSGYKFHNWYDMIWMEKSIGNHISSQPAIIPFSELNNN